MSDLAADAVGRLLRGRFGKPYLYAVETESTQRLLSDSELAEGAVAVAEHQTAGRGRLGRDWSDAPGRALLCSVLLRPPPKHEVAQLSLVVGLAVAVALDELAGLDTQLKWPNDVLLHGRKLAGVLLERAGESVVCGIGINVNQHAEELPGDTRLVPVSLRVATGRDHDRGALLILLLEALEQRYLLWCDNGLRAVSPELEARDVLRGRRIQVGGVTGVADGIDQSGRLAVRLENGHRRLVSSGEVELVASSMSP